MSKLNISDIGRTRILMVVLVGLFLIFQYKVFLYGYYRAHGDFTLVHFSAQTISKSINKITNNNRYNFFINGGGKHHKLLIEDIFYLISNYNYKDLDEININSDFKEALLMSVLGVANILNIKSNIKSVTGAKFSVVCGEEYSG